MGAFGTDLKTCPDEILDFPMMALAFGVGQYHIRHASRSAVTVHTPVQTEVLMEHSLGKDRILEFYLNIIYFGNGIYGISNAAPFYFSRPLSDLTLNQMLILACIPAVPTRGNPIQHPKVFQRVRDRHLARMIKGEKPIIAPAEAEAIYACDADCLDPELKKPDDFTRNFPQTIPPDQRALWPVYRRPGDIRKYRTMLVAH